MTLKKSLVLFLLVFGFLSLFALFVLKVKPVLAVDWRCPDVQTYFNCFNRGLTNCWDLGCVDLDDLSDCSPSNNCECKSDTACGSYPENVCEGAAGGWNYKFGAKCVKGAPDKFGDCAGMYYWKYNNCNAGDRCEDSSVGNIAWDCGGTVDAGTNSSGHILAGRCNASSCPDVGCQNGGWYKTCCKYNDNDGSSGPSAGDTLTGQVSSCASCRNTDCCSNNGGVCIWGTSCTAGAALSSQNFCWYLGSAPSPTSGPTPTSAPAPTSAPGKSALWLFLNKTEFCPGEQITATVCQKPNCCWESWAFYDNLNITVDGAGTLCTASGYQSAPHCNSCATLGNETNTGQDKTCVGVAPSQLGDYTARVYYGGHSGLGYCDDEAKTATQDFRVKALPVAPVSLSGSCAANGTSATVSWQSVPGADHYALRVNDRADGWDGSCSSTTGPGDFCREQSATSYTFSTTPGHTYSWWVHAVNDCGWSEAAYGLWFTCVASASTPTPVPPTPTPTLIPTPTPICSPNCSCAASTCVGQTCPDDCEGWCSGTKTSPAAPSGLTCSVNFSSCAEQAKPNVSLRWTDNSDNETGFKIYHNSSFLYTTLANTTTYSHQVNCDRSLHSYQVRSTNACGDSAFSNSCWVQCADIAPDKATNLSDGTFENNQNILLSWRNINNWGLNCTGNTNEYRVYYCKAGPGCTSTSVPETNRCLPVVNNSPTTGYSSCTIPGPLSWESTYYWKVITSNGALTNEAFGSFKITYPSAWWQTKTGDVYGNEIFSPIWREATSPYFSLIGPFGPQSGLVAAPNCLGPSGARCNFGAAQATQTNFLTSGRGGINANFTPLLDDYSYDQLAHLVDLAIKDNKQESFNSEVKVISGVSADKIEKSELTDPDDANKIIYYYFSDSGSVSVDSPLTMGSGDKKLIIFIDGDLHINKNITVSPGFLAFIVSGDIEIAADVTQVKGVYFADGSLTVESNGATDSQFNGQGIFVGKEGISLKRDFRSAANATTPTEIFTLDPAYLFTAPKVFREKPYLWQEVIP